MKTCQCQKLEIQVSQFFSICKYTHSQWIFKNAVQHLNVHCKTNCFSGLCSMHSNTSLHQVSPESVHYQSYQNTLMSMLQMAQLCFWYYATVFSSQNGHGVGPMRESFPVSFISKLEAARLEWIGYPQVSPQLELQCLGRDIFLKRGNK